MFVLTSPDRLGEVALVQLEERHAEELFAVTDANRASLEEYLPWVAGTRSAQDSLAFIRAARREVAEGRAVHVGIFAGGRLAGHASLMSIVPGHQAEIGYWLAEDAGGRGVATRAVNALVDHAFDELGLRRLFLRVRVGNARSSAIARRLGFQLEGTARGEELHGNELHDLEHYALLR